MATSEGSHAQNAASADASPLAPASIRVVQYELKIGTEGRPTSCKVLKSNASDAQDEGTCRILMRQARFKPATDRHGRPTEATHRGKLTWRNLP